MYKLPSNVTRLIGYIRKSREEELQEERDPSFNALERQRVQMERVLKQYEVPFDLETETVSGGDKIDLRPVFKNVLKKIEDGKYQAIGVREIQRLGRGSYEDMGTIYTLLEEKRIYIITENRIYDLRNPDDAKFIRMQLFMSREEYFFIKERLQGAREYFAGEGKFMSSRPPFGYISNAKTKVLEINEEQAKFVRMIFNWYLNGDTENPQGYGYQAIATKITNLGVKTYTGKNNWQPLHISAMLRNRAYTGVIVYKQTERRGNRQIKRPIEEWIIAKDAHPPIIEIEIFEAVREKLKNLNSKLPVILEFDPCELAGVVTCSCGYRMVRQYSIAHYKKDNGETSTYHKEFLYCKANCKTSVKYRDVENKIIFSLSEIAEMNDELMDQFIEDSISKSEVADVSEGIIDILIKKEQAINQKLKFIFEQYEEKIYTKDEFLLRKSTLQSDLEKTIEQIEIEKLKVNNKGNRTPASIVKANIKKLIETYRLLENKSLKNELLRRTLNKVIVKVVERGSGRNASKLSLDISVNEVLLGISFDLII